MISIKIEFIINVPHSQLNSEVLSSPTILIKKKKHSKPIKESYPDINRTVNLSIVI